MSNLIEELKREAELLGLEGGDVLTYVREKDKIARDERAEEREAEKMRLSLELERARVSAGLELDRTKVSADLELAKVSADLELARMQHELSLAQVSAGNVTGQASLSVDRINKPRLPVYRDGEDITSFLVRFERIAELLNLNRSTWAIHLGTLLSGRAVEIYASLTDTVTADFDSLKKSLLSGFNKTPETYRQEFRNLRIKPDQTYEQFSTQLGRHFDLLLESRDTDKSYEGVRDFVILDQFLASVSSELRLYIKEHGVASLKDTVKLADDWSMARSVREKRAKSPLPSSSKGKASIFNSSKIEHSGLNRSSNSGGPRQSKSFDGKCFSCGSPGHRKFNCPKNPLAVPKPFLEILVGPKVHLISKLV